MKIAMKEKINGWITLGQRNLSFLMSADFI
jgi:hypothetical protein